MLVIILCLIWQLLSQTQANLDQPPYIETNTYTLRKTSAAIVSLSANITYMQNYNTRPQVSSSLASLYSFTPLSNSSFTQQITTIADQYFILEYQFSCNVLLVSCTFTQIDIVYVAYDYSSYPFIQIFTLVHTLDPTIELNNQYYQMYLMNPLQSNHNYELNFIMAGFINLQLTGEPTLYVDAVQNDTESYILQVQFQNLTVTSIQLVRILLDITAMNNAWTSVSSLTCQTGTIYLYQDPLTIENNPVPEYIPFGLFYGIKGFTAWNITLAQMPYIFTNVIPRIQANIGYTLFLTKSCPANQLYVSDQNLCYSLSAAFYYQSSPTSLQRCPASCFQCTGPLTTSCKTCVQGYNRYLSGGRCLCFPGFYDPGAAVCLNCTAAISGCYTCSSAVNCLTCLPGCTAIHFNPIYCDCPNHVQNSSTNCLKNFYFEYDMNTCVCYPQTYYSIDTGLCLPCKIGCYICANNATNCLVCIDEYTLVNNTCMYFYISYSLLGQSSNKNSPQVRCLRWSADNSKCLSTCRYYYYQQNCYFLCPIGTFNISFPWLTCQPCKIDCLFCYNFSICYKCSPQYYYFNTTIKTCSSCSTNCIECANNTYCNLCQNHYQLSNGFCELPQPSYPLCPEACLFCLVSQVCQKCRATYYLNESSGICINCTNSLGLVIGQGGICKEICGDGLIVNHECDDANHASSDGCSSSCQIENHFQCPRINNRSYCWSTDISIFWTVSTVFGKNQIIIDVWSNIVTLSQNLIEISCNFNYTSQSIKTNQDDYLITIQYHQSILMSSNSNDNNTKNYFLSGNATNMCQLTVNQVQTYQIIINAFPESLYITYNSSMETMIQSSLLCNIATYAVIVCLCFNIIGLAPLSSFSSLRVYILILISYMDYSQIPINSFSPFTVLQTLLFTSNSNSTSYLSQFDSNYYFAVLWKLFVLYAGMILIHQIFSRILIILFKRINWKLMNKIMTHQVQNKPLIYQTLYSCYEIVICIIFFKTMANISSSSTSLIVFAFLHLVILIIAKLHFYFTKETILKNNYRFYQAIIIDNIENVTLALFMQFSTQYANYTSLLIIIYAALSLLSLFQSQSPAYSSLTHRQSFVKTQTICSWQYRCNLFLLILIQIVKLINMWRGSFMTDHKYYQYLGEIDGIIMVILVYVLIYFSTPCTLIVQIIRIYEINSAKEEEQLSSNDPISADASSLTEMNN